MHTPLTLIPDEIIRQYNILSLIHNGYIFFQIRKDKYSLLIARKCVNDQLKIHIFPYDHNLVTHTSESTPLFTNICGFTLVYSKKARTNPLLQILMTKYTIIDDTTFDLKYAARTVHFFMSSYIDTVLAQFQHSSPNKLEHIPHDWTSLTCDTHNLP